MFLRDKERRSNGMWRYSVRRITDGACISIRCECNMWPLCSSMRATPLKIITTARRSVHTLMGSKEAFRTKTRAFMVEAILRERAGKCQKSVSEARERRHLACGSPVSLPGLQCQQDAREPPTGMSAILVLAKSIRCLDQRTQIPGLHD